MHVNPIAGVVPQQRRERAAGGLGGDAAALERAEVDGRRELIVRGQATTRALGALVVPPV